jgi:predicted nuclease with TOPRIM domain
MENIIIWALLTGAVTGGVGVAIVLLQRRFRLSSRQSNLIEETERRLDELSDVGTRVTEMEDRLDFAERMLARQREESRLSPPKP